MQFDTKPVPSFRTAVGGTVCIAFLICMFSSIMSKSALADAFERMKPKRLAATRLAVKFLARDLQPVSLSSRYTDYRAVLHIHSHLSHDSNGTVKEIREAARRTGVRVVMFTEHPAPSYDYFKDGHSGLVDGVLFVPGAESGGLLCYPTHSVGKKTSGTPQQRADLVRRDNGMVFLSHLEERMDWDLNGLTGSEIYNIHADFKGESRFIKVLRNPLALIQMIPLIQKYPQETFAALQDYPADYLRRWDELCLKSKLTGIAANDAHHNQGMRAIIDDDGTIRVEDALGQKVAQLDLSKIPLGKTLLGNKKPGDTLFHLDLDPYENSFRHVSTHLMMKELTEASVRQTLQSGRAYVAFDWISDPTGFIFQAVAGKQTFEMGSDAPLVKGLRIQAAAGLPGTFRLLRNGREVTRDRTRTFEYTVTKPGNYRIEVWVNLDDEPRIWILSNPIYVRADGAKK